MATKPTYAVDLILAICEAINVKPDNVVRIVIDAAVGKIYPTVYIEERGSDMLKVDWAGHLSETKIRFKRQERD